MGTLRKTTLPEYQLESLKVSNHVGFFFRGQHVRVRGHPVSAGVNQRFYVRFRRLFAVGELVVLEQALQSRTHLLLIAVGVMANRTIRFENLFTLGGVAGGALCALLVLRDGDQRHETSDCDQTLLHAFSLQSREYGSQTRRSRA